MCSIRGLVYEYSIQWYRLDLDNARHPGIFDYGMFFSPPQRPVKWIKRITAVGSTTGNVRALMAVGPSIDIPPPENARTP